MDFILHLSGWGLFWFFMGPITLVEVCWIAYLVQAPPSVSYTRTQRFVRALLPGLVTMAVILMVLGMFCLFCGRLSVGHGVSEQKQSGLLDISAQEFGNSGVSINTSVVNHTGAAQGYDVWNSRNEDLDMYRPGPNGTWEKFGTLLAGGGYQSFPCHMPNIHAEFRGANGFVDKLDDNAVNSAGGWKQHIIR